MLSRYSVGRRENISLNHLLQFVTGADEEPPLGFGAHRTIEFAEATGTGPYHFTPKANTCSNTLRLPRPTHNIKQPDEKMLFDIYDMAFRNSYFG